jgi:hypothetical protein
VGLGFGIMHRPKELKMIQFKNLFEGSSVRQSWALPQQVAIFRFSLLSEYRKNEQNSGLKTYQ